jgi:hypothetical protein
MDALNQKAQALEHTVGDLALQTNKSVKIGQTVTLHAGGHGGMPYLLWSSGDQGGFVSWASVPAALWTIN